jgi:signal transduction histidine kinase
MVRDRPLQREPVRLAEVVAAARSGLRWPAGVAVELVGLGGLPEIEGDAGQLRQVLVNLLENAAFAAAPSGTVTIRGRPEASAVALDVEDTGPGVDPVTRRRLFEPLITTKDKGIGLGLALVKRIVERHGGTVAYEPRPGGGARFTVRLPG